MLNLASYAGDGLELKPIFRTNRELQILNLQGAIDITNDPIIEAATYLELLSYISLSGCKHIDNTAFKLLFKKCHVLKRINLAETGANDETIEVYNTYSY